VDYDVKDMALANKRLLRIEWAREQPEAEYGV